MEADEVVSPEPVFPSGSVSAASIPLLTQDDDELDAGEIPSLPAAPSDTAGPAIESAAPEPPIERTATAEMSVPPTRSHDSGVTVVDDSIVQPSSMPETVVSIDNPLIAPFEQAEPDQKSSNDMPAPAVSETIDAQATDQAIPVEETSAYVATQVQPMALPSGVDLQKLLSSFNTTPLEPAVTSGPVSAVTSNIPSSIPVTPNPVTNMQTKPSVPWQQVQPLPPSKPASSTRESDDAVYEQFLVDEKRIMGNTAPHEFEPGSRLFIGNMNIETTSKRQMFFIFKKYGKLAQVALKTTYGFVQFLTARECRNAVDGEQGFEIAGKKLHLEVSKPQAPRNAPAQSRRRSRSPPRKPAAQAYGRDSYEPYSRSPPPPRRASPGRFHVPYDAQYPQRRSPSPRRYAAPPVDPLPPRYGAQIPDVQIVVLDQADRSYIHWVESSIRDAGFRVETLFLSPQLELPTVVRQMAKEGVLAIVQCHRQLQMVNKVSLQVFDRSQGQNSVRFDEYAGLDMGTAIGLLKRSQQQASAARPPPAQPQQANLAAMIAQMDPASLQQVIGALSQQQQNPPAPSYPPSSYPYRR